MQGGQYYVTPSFVRNKYFFIWLDCFSVRYKEFKPFFLNSSSPGVSVLVEGAVRTNKHTRIQTIINTHTSNLFMLFPELGLCAA